MSSRKQIWLLVVVVLVTGFVLARTILRHPTANNLILTYIKNNTDYMIQALRAPPSTTSTPTNDVVTTTTTPTGRFSTLQKRPTTNSFGGNTTPKKRPTTNSFGGNTTPNKRPTTNSLGGNKRWTGGSKKQIPVILFSTWNYDKEKTEIRANVLRIWGSWRPSIFPHLYTDDDKIKKQAKSHGWGFQSNTKTTCGGVPILREMFRRAMETYDSVLYGFVNGDILLGHGLLKSLEAVIKMPFVRTEPVMVIFRRINVNFMNRAPVHDVTNISQIAEQGRLMTDGSSDGFFTNRLFPWDHVPDIVIGRLGVAMWMVSFAREMGAHVIDITDTTTAVHMSTRGGNAESWKYKTRGCNHIIYNKLNVKPKSWYCGFSFCAAYKTVEVTRGNVTEVKVFDKRKENSIRCSECNMNLKPLINTIF